MKKTEAIKLAEIQATKELALSIITNPVIAMVLGITFLEIMERKGYGGDWVTPLAQGGVAAVATAQALAPLAPGLLATGEGAGIVKTLLSKGIG